MANLLSFQTVKTPRPDNKDHVWFRAGERFKCRTCGAVALEPPPYPTPKDWMPVRFEKLTAEEKAF